MSIKENIAVLNPDITCCKCLKEGYVHNIKINSMGYGSGFDSWSTQINLCNDCYNETNSEWWKLKKIPTDVGYPEDDYTFYEYEYENEIFKYVKTMPLAGQELFWNRYSTDNYIMEPQDWIDYKLDILPHEKCKEYGMYSPQEIQAYNDRFPKCKHVKLKVYSDDSAHTLCFRNAFGEKDGSCNKHNISNECYMCIHFEERTEDIKTIYVVKDEMKREIQHLREMIKYATNKLKNMESE